MKWISSWFTSALLSPHPVNGQPPVPESHTNQFLWGLLFHSLFPIYSILGIGTDFAFHIQSIKISSKFAFARCPNFRQIPTFFCPIFWPLCVLSVPSPINFPFRPLPSTPNKFGEFIKLSRAAAFTFFSRTRTLEIGADGGV
jgi:hypothetical protein